MPDMLSLYSQLGVSPPVETWVMPTDDCNQLFDWDTGYINPFYYIELYNDKYKALWTSGYTFEDFGGRSI